MPSRVLPSLHRRITALVAGRRGRRRLGSTGTSLGAGSRVRILGTGRVHLARGVRIDPHAQIAVFGVLTIGEGTTIGDHLHLNVKEAVTIGPRCELSWRVTIMDTDFHTLTGTDGAQGPMTAPVEIGEHVLIGAGVTILKGVRIRDGAVIGAGSVVTRDVPAGWLAAGNPAREIREVADWS